MEVVHRDMTLVLPSVHDCRYDWKNEHLHGTACAYRLVMQS